MTLPPSFVSLLGFARKSGKLLAGEHAVKTGMKRRTALLLILAEDLPEKRKAAWVRWCEEQAIPYIEIGTKDEFSQILGMSARSILAITDQQMAKALGNNSTKKQL